MPGHLVHFIQARKAWESDDPVRWGRFGGIEDGRLVVRFLDGTARYGIHRPDEVALVAQLGDKVRVSERWRVASLSRRFEHLGAVCIALPDDRWRPCSVAPDELGSFEDLAGRLIGRGGFVAPGPHLVGLLDAEPEPPAGPA